MIRSGLASLSLAFLFIGSLSCAIADDALNPRPFIGHLVKARVTPSGSLYLWDASTYVGKLIVDRIPNEIGLRAMEASGVSALADSAKDDPSGTLILRASYLRTGEVSPIYGSPTFSGVEVVFTISAKKSDLIKNAAMWETTLEQGGSPRGCAIDMLGKLPQ